MDCKFCAEAMSSHPSQTLRRSAVLGRTALCPAVLRHGSAGRRSARVALASLVVGLGLGGPLSAGAERADRSQPMTLESDKPCSINLARQTSVCSGNVVVVQGTLQLRADKLELRESADGYHAVASGSATRPAQYRQKRDGVDEYIEGQAQRIEYDGRSSTLHFAGQAEVRRLRGGAPADVLRGSLIVYDGRAEQIDVQGASSTNPGGRVQAVIAPRQPAPAASSAAASAGGAGERR